MAAIDEVKKALWDQRKSILQGFVLFCIINICFLSAVSSVGVHVFIDTFEHHESYVFVENDCLDSQGKLLIVMSQSHPEFSAEENTTLLRIKATNQQGSRRACVRRAMPRVRRRRGRSRPATNASASPQY